MAAAGWDEERPRQDSNLEPSAPEGNPSTTEIADSEFLSAIRLARSNRRPVTSRQERSGAVKWSLLMPLSQVGETLPHEPGAEVRRIVIDGP